jgi:hypothetical protein
MKSRLEVALEVVMKEGRHQSDQRVQPKDDEASPGLALLR